MMDDIINQYLIPVNISNPPSRVQRVRHELKRRALQVVRIETLSPHVRSITFGGDSLADFISASFDDHVKLMLDLGGDQPVMRDYTPRHFDPVAHELTIEFALHGDGPAARWAAQAAPGQKVAVGGPRGSFIIPLDHDWHLFVGDESALPAIARRLEELPAGTQAIAIVQAGDAAVRALRLPPGGGYAWCAGEAKAMATLRRLLVDEKGHPCHAIRAAAYWKHGAAGHHENLED